MLREIFTEKLKYLSKDLKDVREMSQNGFQGKRIPGTGTGLARASSQSKGAVSVAAGK